MDPFGISSLSVLYSIIKNFRRGFRPKKALTRAVHALVMLSLLIPAISVGDVSMML